MKQPLPTPKLRLQRRPTCLGAALALLLMACDDLGPLRTPSDPVAQLQSVSSDVFEDGEFLYYRPFVGGRDYRIPVSLDPTLLIVSAKTPAAIMAAVNERQLTAELTADLGHARPGHHSVRLDASTAEEARSQASALRSDPRIDFVGHAYFTAGGAHTLLVDRLVVRFKKEARPEQIIDLLDSINAGVLRLPPTSRPGGSYWLSYPRGEDPARFAATLNDLPLVDWASADRMSEVRPASHAPTDPLYGQQYYLRNSETLYGANVDVAVEPAWDNGYTGQNITVAIIGEGVDGSHPELAGRKASTGGQCGTTAGWDEALDSLVVSGGPWEPYGQLVVGTGYENRHETFVAGIIAAQHDNAGVVGIAPAVKLLSARVFLGEQAAMKADFADALEWAWQDCGADVVNGSFEFNPSDPSTEIAQAIGEGSEEGRAGLGTVFVFSAGNETNRDNNDCKRVAFPANLDCCAISVGAIDQFGTIANYSPRRPPWWQCLVGTPPCPPVDLVAPSGHYSTKQYGGNECNPTPPSPAAPNVVTTDLGGARGCNSAGSNYHDAFSGTSATAPQVAAAAVLLLSASPTLTASQVKTALKTNADAWGPTDDFGAGKLNIAAALGVAVPLESVTISGNSEVLPNENCTWWAVVDGGQSPLSLIWRKDGAIVGSGSTELTLNTGSSSFNLSFEVEDHYGQRMADTIAVTVTATAFECFM